MIPGPRSMTVVEGVVYKASEMGPASTRHSMDVVASFEGSREAWTWPGGLASISAPVSKRQFLGFSLQPGYEFEGRGPRIVHLDCCDG